MRTLFSHAFGSEYGFFQRWGFAKSWYVRLIGVVDFPSRVRARLIKAEVGKAPWTSLCDVACGVGTYVFYLSRNRGSRVLGIEINRDWIAECRMVAEQLGRRNAEFRSGDAQLALRDCESSSMDVVLIIEALELFCDPVAVLKDCRRILRPGGRLIGHVPVLSQLRPHEKWLIDDAILRRFLTEAGFEETSIRPTFGYPMRWLYDFYVRVQASWLLTALLFPFLLMLSRLCPIEGRGGNYRLFVGRKPAVSVVDATI